MLFKATSSVVLPPNQTTLITLIAKRRITFHPSIHPPTMTFLDRSLVFYAALILAFVACGTEAALRQRAQGYLSFDSTLFDGADAEEIEAELQAEYAEDYSEGEQPPEDPVVEEREIDEDFIPPGIDFELSQEEQDWKELEMLAHHVEEAMMRATELESQALYEQELAGFRVEEGATEDEVEQMTDEASMVLADVLEMEEELLQEKQRVNDELKAMAASSEERRRKLMEQEKHLNKAMKELHAQAEERRRDLMEGIAARGKKSATLNGITYEVEW